MTKKEEVLKHMRDALPKLLGRRCVLVDGVVAYITAAHYTNGPSKKKKQWHYKIEALADSKYATDCLLTEKQLMKRVATIFGVGAYNEIA